MLSSMCRVAAVAAMCVAFTTAALAAGPPEAVMRMLNEAARDDDAGQLTLTAMLAKRAYPEAALEIDRTVRRLERQKQRRKVAEAPRSFRDGWAGEGEVGASTSSGNTNETSINLGFRPRATRPPGATPSPRRGTTKKAPARPLSNGSSDATSHSTNSTAACSASAFCSGNATNSPASTGASRNPRALATTSSVPANGVGT